MSGVISTAIVGEFVQLELVNQYSSMYRYNWLISTMNLQVGLGFRSWYGIPSTEAPGESFKCKQRDL